MAEGRAATAQAQATAAELAAWLGAELLGDGHTRIARIASLEAADGAALSFIAQARLQGHLASSNAGCLIVKPAQRDAALARLAARGAGHAVLLIDDPYLAYARLTQRWAQARRGAPVAGVHPSAVVEPGARIHATAHVGALAFIGAGAVLEEGAVVAPQAHVGEGAVLGAFSRLATHATLGAGCRMGARGLLHSGAVIGADGFGFAPNAGRWEKIEQLGAVLLGDDVEIGANTCIDRGALDDTVLEDGVKIDNLVQIAHNVRIGAHTAVAGCVGIAGSARIGRHCTLGGAAMILGHLEIVDHVHITSGTLVSRSIRKPGQYSGAFPFDDNASWEKNAATLRQLHTLRDRVRALERQLEARLIQAPENKS